MHFESLLKPNNVPELDIDLTECPYIPCLDDPISPMEVEKAVKSVKNKGYVGVATGLFRWVPVNILLYILQVLNIVFNTGTYPALWTHTKLITIFKSGQRLACGNYRGIAIGDSLSKIYDTIINNRLSEWIAIDKAQAGAQKGRGCVEQIMSLRLLIDFSMVKRHKLYLIFVDFQKAYDKVPRNKLLECLRQRGCGAKMLLALKTIYRCTRYVLRSAIISATIGVRQGASTSCLLFVFYIDFMVQRVKLAYAEDGFLGSLHVLLLMDDTVILATSKEMARNKFTTLLDFCAEFGMVVNEKKTKIMIFNGCRDERVALTVRNMIIGYSSHYIYLGAHFTDDGKMTSVINHHAADCAKHVYKFATFVNKNTNMPYHLKKRVMDAALMSAMLYSCETWLCNNTRQIAKHYMSLIKSLLGVRGTTTNLLCLLEGGFPDLDSLILKRRISFITKFQQSSAGDEPLAVVLNLCKDANTKGYKMLNAALNYIGDPVIHSVETLKRQCIDRRGSSTKIDTYCILNPTLEVHEVYTIHEEYIPDFKRMAFTRFRLSAHRLKIETGRWLRLAREDRLCVCNLEIQDEAHVMFNCPYTLNIRQKHNIPDNIINWTMIFSRTPQELCEITSELMNIFN